MCASLSNTQHNTIQFFISSFVWIIFFAWNGLRVVWLVPLFLVNTLFSLHTVCLRMDDSKQLLEIRYISCRLSVYSIRKRNDTWTNSFFRLGIRRSKRGMATKKVISFVRLFVCAATVKQWLHLSTRKKPKIQMHGRDDRLMKNEWRVAAVWIHISRYRLFRLPRRHT